MKIGKRICKFIGYMRSIPLNFKLFPLKIAYKLPLIVSPFVKIKSLKGVVKLESPIVKTGMLEVGFGNVGIFDSVLSRTLLDINGKMIFYGKAAIGHGSKISVGKDGVLEIGKAFHITAESSIVCHKKIKFGDNVLISWENLFMDTDFHKIRILNEINNEPEEIIIGDNVWFGCRSTILKGSKISDNSVVGANSLINKQFEENNVLITGNPSRVIKKNITWEK